MRQPPMLTTELTLQLEQHVAPNETRPPEQEGSQVARFGKTIASLERAPWPPSRVFCFNVGELDRLTDHRQMFLARYEGEPAGVGELSKSRAFDNWGGLGSATVIPRFRRRGIQTALLQHRLHRAYQIGYELVVGGADFGSVSFRNQQRVGLRLGYIETVWKKLKS